ncbi:MAG: MFS transporter [Roseburia sp.]|nr:MFS transporter [Roseburia sp.]MCM1097077.1 MFS transporter [Ruminococcus flavefaciens]MCM1223502.1 MFS transporter [Lachnospiraceae bacterium]
MAKQKTQGGFWSKSFMDSRIKSANTEGKEKVWGYFVGPMFMMMAYYGIAGTYITQFYTDVLGISGALLTMMPFFSKIFDAITNVIMGRIIDKTRTRQGKARPWLLASGFFITFAGILLYNVPRAGYQVQIVWIIISYNLFFAFAYTIYNMSHTLMVPLSTRNTKQRDSLAMLTSTGTSMIPGMLVTVIMPVVVKNMGVGIEAQGKWALIMSLLSIFAIPAVLIEYYFTKERVTEESISESGENTMEVVPMMDQIRACLSNKYWWMVMAFWAIYQVTQFLNTNIMLYFCNWVLGNSVASGAGNQILVNAIGQAPLGFGIFILWPLVHKFGKRWVTQIGFVIGAVGCLLVLLNPSNLGMVLAGMMIKSIGCLPTYAMAAFLAEAMDHIEWEKGYRVDGFTASVNTIIVTIAAGIGQSIILGGLDLFDYISPASIGATAETVINQPASAQNFMTWMYVGVPMIGYLIIALIFSLYDLEDKIPQIAKDITARHKAEAEARGEVYITAEEKEAMEIAEQEKKADEIRIKELKEKCAKQGLSFEEEEAKYQAQLAEKKAKEEAKRAAKEAKKRKK